MRVVAKRSEFSLLDYGCGYGALADYLDAQEYVIQVLSEMNRLGRGAPPPEPASPCTRCTGNPGR